MIGLFTVTGFINRMGALLVDLGAWNIVAMILMAWAFGWHYVPPGYESIGLHGPRGAAGSHPGIYRHNQVAPQTAIARTGDEAAPAGNLAAVLAEAKRDIG
jgi:hypothetical protein